MRFASKFLAFTLVGAAFGFAASFGSLSCGGTPADQDAGIDAGDPFCIDSSECGDPNCYRCNQATGNCEPGCRSKANCMAHCATGGAPLPQCTGTFGCVCDEGVCKPFVCSADSECGAGSGLLCLDGACKAAPTAASCTVWPSYAVMHLNRETQFYVIPKDATGRPVPLGASFDWVANDGFVERVDATSGKFKGLKAHLPTEPKSPSVKAQLRTNTQVSCTAEVLVYGAVAAGRRVVVIDELSGRPLAGARVVVGSLTGADTDARGTALFPAASTTSPLTVSVFHADFTYLTIVDTLKADLLIPMRRHTNEKWGGYKGKFTNLSRSAEIHIGVAGTSIPGSLTDFSFDVLVGPSIPTTIEFSGNKFPDAPIPSGVVIGVGGATPFKEAYQALGIAGACGDDAKMASGSCGTRAGWSLMGDVQLSKIAPLFDQFSGGNIDVGKLLAAILPQFKSFRSQVLPDVTFDLSSATATAGGKTVPDFAIDATFPVKNMTPSVPLGIKAFLEVPTLPKSGGNFMEGAVILGGSMVPGRGVVPLGLTAGVDADATSTNAALRTPDGKLNSETASDGVATLRMAPNNGGIEGSKYGVVAIALSLSSAGVGGASATISGLVGFYDKIPYQESPSAANNLKFQAGGFVTLPEAASYDFRTGTLTTGPAIGGANVYRLAFTNSRKQRWVVYFSGSGTVGVPPTPNLAAFPDRTMAGDADRTDLNSGQAGSDFLLTAMKVDVTGDTDVVGHLFNFNPSTADATRKAASLVNFTSAFGVQDYGYPDVSIDTPKACTQATIGNCTEVKCTGGVKVEVANAKLGDGTGLNHLVLKVYQGTALTAGNLKETINSGATPLTKGAITMSFTGTGWCADGEYTIVAELANQANAAIDPPARNQARVRLVP